VYYNSFSSLAYRVQSGLFINCTYACVISITSHKERFFTNALGNALSAIMS
jgi:hypothetical protein